MEILKAYTAYLPAVNIDGVALCLLYGLPRVANRGGRGANRENRANIKEGIEDTMSVLGSMIHSADL